MNRFLKFLRHAFNSPLQDAYDKMVDAQQYAARIAGECAYHQGMTEFYESCWKSLDPHTHWWEFATAKQKESEHAADWAHEELRRQAAEAALSVRMDNYLKLKAETK